MLKKQNIYVQNTKCMRRDLRINVACIYTKTKHILDFSMQTVHVDRF